MCYLWLVKEQATFSLAWMIVNSGYGFPKVQYLMGH